MAGSAHDGEEMPLAGPPNRDEGERGFLTYEGFRTYEADGHVHAPAGVTTPADPRDIM